MVCPHTDHVSILVGVACRVKGDIRRKNGFAGLEQFSVICR
jgi:hypothetical protein